MTETTAAKLARLHDERRETGRPESLTELRDRVRFAADWLAKRSQDHRDAYWNADAFDRDRCELGMSIARSDAGLILASIAESLDTLVGR